MVECLLYEICLVKCLLDLVGVYSMLKSPSELENGCIIPLVNHVILFDLILHLRNIYCCSSFHIRKSVEFTSVLLVARLLHFILRSKKRQITILKDVNGMIKPCRMTLLLGPPSSGKTTVVSIT